MTRLLKRQAVCLCIGLSLVATVSAITTRAVADAPGRDAWRERETVLGALQLRVLALDPGGVLELEPGIHQGPIVIRTPGVTIRGVKGSIIDGEGHGTVVIVEADDVTLENFEVTGSGTSHDQVDAGVSVRNAARVKLRQLVVVDCLFGIDIAKGRDVSLEDSRISSKSLDLGLRGDAIRIWASRDIVIRGNHWRDTRDAVSWYSERVRFEDNDASRARYSVHSMYSKSLIIQNNRFLDNSVGIFIMYGEGTTILDNLVRGSLGATGIGLGMKETSSLFARGNRFIYCSTGILVDNSPWNPDSRNWFQENYIAFDGVGVLFSSGREGNLFEANTFEANGVDADSETRTQSQSTWRGNYWDAYDGFDRDGNRVGDTPYRVIKYADLMTGSHPAARFFYATPVAALVGLVERLLPLTEPTVLLEDHEPRLVSIRSDEQSGVKGPGEVIE